MIPKTIHYCWFGKGPIPALAQKCLLSWKKYLPEYKLKLWDESNFDINSNAYVKEAYNARKFAFVTDYVRLFALFSEGGIYMDTDVQVIKSLDHFLQFPAFTGFESDVDVPTGIIGSEKGGAWSKEQLACYENRHFLIRGKPDLTTNVQLISGNMARNGFVLKNSYQVYKNCLHVFPKDYFCPKSRTGVLILTENTHCIHHFNGSWQSKRMKMKKFLFHKVLGTYFTDKLVRLKRSIIKKVSK